MSEQHNEGKGRRPTDEAALLAMIVTGREWLYADEIRGELKKLGFDRTTQQISGQLARMGREDMACVEGERRYGNRVAQYRITRFGITLAENTWDGIRWALREARVREATGVRRA